MASLNELQRQAFDTVAARLGFQPGETSFDMSHPAFKKEVVLFGADPDKVDMTGKVVPVGSIAELKALIGLPDHPVDDHVDYPTPLSTALNSGSDEQLDVNIKVATVAYLLGHPAKVVDYEDLINNSLFPGKALVFNVEDLQVGDGQVVTLGKSGDTEIYNYGTITVAPTGQIQVVGNTSVTCQVFTQL